tara:strand:+ start:188 stop:424 length:237 start_codon:yes stop_codon:yes gene_type:complete
MEIQLNFKTKNGINYEVYHDPKKLELRLFALIEKFISPYVEPHINKLLMKYTDYVDCGKISDREFDTLKTLYSDGKKS